MQVMDARYGRSPFGRAMAKGQDAAPLLEKALACADRVYALVQGTIALEAVTGESDLAHRLERAYFGHESHALG